MAGTQNEWNDLPEFERVKQLWAARNELELPEGPFTADDVETNHRRLSFKFHPDRNRGNATAEKKMRSVNSARDSLKQELERLRLFPEPEFASVPFEDVTDVRSPHNQWEYQSWAEPPPHFDPPPPFASWDTRPPPPPIFTPPPGDDGINWKDPDSDFGAPPNFSPPPNFGAPSYSRPGPFGQAAEDTRRQQEQQRQHWQQRQQHKVYGLKWWQELHPIKQLGYIFAGLVVYGLLDAAYQFLWKPFSRAPQLPPTKMQSAPSPELSTPRLAVAVEVALDASNVSRPVLGYLNDGAALLDTRPQRTPEPPSIADNFVAF